MARRDEIVLEDGALTPPLRAVTRLKNNRLIRAREGLGYTLTAAALAIGIHYTHLCAFENLRLSPRNARWGSWTKKAQKVAEFYDIPPEELWPDEVMSVGPTTFTHEIEVSDLPRLAAPTPEDSFLAEETFAKLRALLDAPGLLSPRERSVLALRFADADAAFADVGAALGITRERARQIELKALGKLRAALPREGLALGGQVTCPVCAAVVSSLHAHRPREGLVERAGAGGATLWVAGRVCDRTAQFARVQREVAAPPAKAAP